MNQFNSILHVLMGPSGSGKTTLGKYLRELGVPELISHTTRSPREGEINGIDYYFVTLEEFQQIPMIERTEYDGNLYGTSLEEVNSKMAGNLKCFVIADYEGVKQYKAYLGEERVKVIFITAPLEELKRRLEETRGPEEAARRLIHARETGEFDNWKYADFIIINKDLEISKRDLKEFIGI